MFDLFQNSRDLNHDTHYSTVESTSVTEAVPPEGLQAPQQQTTDWRSLKPQKLSIDAPNTIENQQAATLAYLDAIAKLSAEENLFPNHQFCVCLPTQVRIRPSMAANLENSTAVIKKLSPLNSQCACKRR